MITAVILAAGLSKRFSGQKLLAHIGEKPMVKHVVDLVTAMDFERRIFVYSNDEVLRGAFESADQAAAFILRYNPSAEDGLSSSIRLALEHDEADGVIFFPGDQPLIDEATVGQLLKAFDEKKGSIIVPVYEGKRGNPVIFAGKWVEQLKDINGDVGGRKIIESNPREVWEVVIEDSWIGFDIDTREAFHAYHSERISK